MRALRAHFALCDDDGGDYAIEVDPREVVPGTLARGLVPSADDRLRADVIGQLRGRLTLDVAATAARYGIDFWDYFARERSALGRWRGTI